MIKIDKNFDKIALTLKMSINYSDFKTLDKGYMIRDKILMVLLLFIYCNAVELQWGDTVRIDMNPNKAKMIIKKYVDKKYPKKVKQYNQYLNNKKQAKIAKYSDVTFTQNSLMWQDNIDTLQKKFDVLEFKMYCQKLILANRKDWRAPKYSELLELVDYKKLDLASLKKIKFIQPTKYWSNAKSNSKQKGYWYVNFQDGTTGIANETQRYNIRCVRKISRKAGKY